jgi:hypothetical protein
MTQRRQPYLPLAAFMADTISSTEYPIPVPRLNTEYSPNPFRIERDKKRDENKGEYKDENKEKEILKKRKCWEIGNVKVR